MGDNEKFTVADHTKIVKAVIDHPLQVVRYLDRRPGHRPTYMEVMDAALQVQCFDSETKRVMHIAREAGAQHADLITSTTDGPAAERRRQARAALEGKTIPDMIGSLDRLLQQEADDETMSGLRLARDILIDGAGTIYSPTYPANEYLETVAASAAFADAPAHTTGAQHVAQADADTAAMVGGTDVGGAVAGFVSVGEVILTVYDAFFT